MSDPIPIFPIPFRVQTPNEAINELWQVLHILYGIFERILNPLFCWWNFISLQYSLYFFIPLIVSLLYYYIMDSPRNEEEERIQYEEYFGPIYKVAEHTQPGFSIVFIDYIFS